MKLYKVLDGNRSCNGGNYEWSLPAKNEDGTWTPGDWTEPVDGELIACENGYHLADESQLLEWLGLDIYEAETEEASNDGQKWVARRVRLVRKIEAWNEKSARLFACWCVRQIWHLLSDERSRNAVIVAEKFTNGEATREELSAAWAAARAAAGTAARAAAGAAAGAAAWTAARAAARAAARDAAWAAAWAAARAAAWDAAWAAARAAARDAAWAAARAAQTEKLLEIINV